MDTKQIIATAGSVDWQQIESQNPYMLSFQNEMTGARCNVYYTTSTVTIQRGGDPCQTFRNVDIKEFENILTSHA